MRNVFIAALALLAATPAFAAWEFKVIEDPMTDAKRGISTLMGDQGALFIKCDDNGIGSLYFSIASREFLGGTPRSRWRTVQYRVDGGPIQSLQASHDGSVASVFDVALKDPGGAFLAEIATAKRLVVQVSDYNSDIKTIVFDVTGARQAIAKSAETCGDTEWLPGK